MGTRPDGDGLVPEEAGTQTSGTPATTPATTPAEAPADATSPAPGRRRLRRALRKAWPAARIIIGFGLVGVAVWVLSSRTSELEGFSTAFRKFNWWWVPPAVAVEIGSYY